MNLKILIFLLGIIYASNGFGLPKRHYTTERLQGNPPIIDGVLDDNTWLQGTWTGDFLQFEPYNGSLPSHQTEFKILYDDDNLYIAIRAFDNSPDSIEKRLTRRDLSEGDNIAIGFDSYYDLRTCFAFGVNAIGVKYDMVISEDGDNMDYSWDPIWWVKTSIDSLGWVAEMRIPLNQLRFEKESRGLWGVQVVRGIFRYGEQSFWNHIPSDASGFVCHFGTMDGFEDIRSRSIFDITPYAVSSLSSYPADGQNPFLTGRDQQNKLGLDIKAGLTNHLTLDMTFNPDFGQVEADPSEVNLTAYESYFQEKRPFFIEGRNISSFDLSGFSNDNLFYSRRIGRKPRYNPETEDGAFIRLPSHTSIIGAAKITGKTRNGLSLAFIETVTGEAKAETAINENRAFETTEPLTNYFVGRMQKDYKEGNVLFGGMLTSVHRKTNPILNNELHRSAYSGGLDFMHLFRDKTWMLAIKAAISHVQGTEATILQTQQSSVRYFQRPDASHLQLDSTRTSLTGTGGQIEAGKTGGGHWRIYSALMWNSPEFEINDLGFMRQTDNLLQVLWVSYNIWEPRSFYRSYSIGMGQVSNWSFEKQRLYSGWRLEGSIRYKNYQYNYIMLEYSHEAISTGMLRGGPSIRLPEQFFVYFGGSSDNRKRIIVSYNGSMASAAEDYLQRTNISGGLTYIPFRNFNISLRPSYSYRNEALQYIDEISNQGVNRYLMGSIRQQVMSFSLRLNFTLFPDFSIQYWGQPFVASGKYSDFKYITNPDARVLADRFQLFNPNQIFFSDNLYHIDENLDGITDYRFENPDFNIKEFLSNMVLRWEFIPGSVLFLVWNQNRISDEYSNFNYIRNLDQLFAKKSYNVFLLKLTYRIGVN